MAKQPKSATNNQWTSTAKTQGGAAQQGSEKVNAKNKNK